MAPIRYMDFDVEIQPEGDGFRAQVRSPGGEATARFGTIFPEIELENYLLKLGQARRSTRRIDSPAYAAAKALGKRLFGAVFTDDVRDCLRTSSEKATQQDAGLRIRLHLKDVPALANLPWEYIFDASVDRFLALSRYTPVVRYLALRESIRTTSVVLPLRILVMISSPKLYPPLDVEREWASLRDAVRPFEKEGLITLARLEKATIEELNVQLQREEFHVLHFIGHGGFDPATQDGLLVLEDNHGNGRPTSGEKLGVFLHDHRSMRLAVLNACEGARSSTTDPFAGVAQTLIQQRIPAVVGMQFEITDEAAITFAKKFYGALVGGDPVDAALSAARMAIFAENDGLEWGTPVLYMRSPDGCLFELAKTGRSGPKARKSIITSPAEDHSVLPSAVHNTASEGSGERAEVEQGSTAQEPETTAGHLSKKATAPRYSHHASALGLAGRISRPVQESIVPQGVASLPIIGGHMSARAEMFRLRDIASFRSVAASVAGSWSQDEIFRTNASVTVEGLNILNVITADRVVTRLSASYHSGDIEPSIVPTGSHFENLRIAGQPVRIEFAVDACRAGDTYSAMREVFAGEKGLSRRYGFQPQGSLALLFSFVERIEIQSRGDIRTDGHVIHVADFGEIHLGELEIRPGMRHLTMLRLKTNFAVEGSLEVASCECGGTPVGR